MPRGLTAAEAQRDYDQILEQAVRQPGVAAAMAVYERAERVETEVAASYTYGMTVAVSTNSPVAARR